MCGNSDTVIHTPSCPGGHQAPYHLPVADFAARAPMSHLSVMQPPSSPPDGPSGPESSDRSWSMVSRRVSQRPACLVLPHNGKAEIGKQNPQRGRLFSGTGNDAGAVDAYAASGTAVRARGSLGVASCLASPARVASSVGLGLARRRTRVGRHVPSWLWLEKSADEPGRAAVCSSSRSPWANLPQKALCCLCVKRRTFKV